ncbi:hypothetical protein GOC54_16340 [Sinorhizobium meliloti]|nr:hypothetical protein [Sinorhizobium meliloti]MDX0165472.1 hypothetical protein [Sinorhizobium meliloti]MDX0312629.1 hypothetical protein [Sinorhizobium meliloti]
MLLLMLGQTRDRPKGFRASPRSLRRRRNNHARSGLSRKRGVAPACSRETKMPNPRQPVPRPEPPPPPDLPPWYPEPPIEEPDPDRLPDEIPVPNPDENPEPPKHI